MPVTRGTWPVNRAMITPPLPAEDADDYDTALARQFAMEDLAVSTLWALTGRQFGVYETTIRPRADEHQPLDNRIGISPYRFDNMIFGDFRRASFFGGLTPYGGGNSLISGYSMVTLPGPVYPPDDDHPIVITFGLGDGTTKVLGPDEYRVEGDVLFRPNMMPWPFQNLSRPLGEHDTWSVKYWRGTPPPAGAGTYVAILVNELLAAAVGDPKCRLPARVTRLARQGVSYDLDPTQLYRDGKIGIPEIDAWLAAINPNRLMQAPRVI